MGDWCDICDEEAAVYIIRKRSFQICEECYKGFEHYQGKVIKNATE